MSNLYDKLGNIFDIQQSIIMESIETHQDNEYLDLLTFESIEDIDVELAIATEAYLDSEADMIGNIVLTNQYIAFENMLDFNPDMLEEDIMDESVVLEAVTSKELDKELDKENNVDKGLWNKIKTFFKNLWKSIITVLKLAKISSIKKIKLGNRAKKLISEVRAQNIKPNYVTYNKLDAALIKNTASFIKNRADESKSIAEAVAKLEKFGDKKTYTDGKELFTMLDSLIRSGCAIVGVNYNDDPDKWLIKLENEINNTKDQVKGMRGALSDKRSETQNTQTYADAVIEYASAIAHAYSKQHVLNNTLEKDFITLNRQLDTLNKSDLENFKDKNVKMKQVSELLKCVNVMKKNMDLIFKYNSEMFDVIYKDSAKSLGEVPKATLEKDIELGMTDAERKQLNKDQKSLRAQYNAANPKQPKGKKTK